METVAAWAWQVQHDGAAASGTQSRYAACPGPAIRSTDYRESPCVQPVGAKSRARPTYACVERTVKQNILTFFFLISLDNVHLKEA
jgi:hypothetical protein